MASTIEHADNKVGNNNNDSNSNKELYITTIDNPFDPQTQYDEWRNYDQQLGYNTEQRLASTIDYLQDQARTDDEDLLYELALVEMVRLNPLKVYKIITRPAKNVGVVHVADPSLNPVTVGSKL